MLKLREAREELVIIVNGLKALLLYASESDRTVILFD